MIAVPPDIMEMSQNHVINHAHRVSVDISTGAHLVYRARANGVTFTYRKPASVSEDGKRHCDAVRFSQLYPNGLHTAQEKFAGLLEDVNVMVVKVKWDQGDTNVVYQGAATEETPGCP